MLLEKWLVSSRATEMRISRFVDMGSGRRRQVRVELRRVEDSVEIVFFRHDDGTWHVFPPGRERWSIGIGDFSK